MRRPDLKLLPFLITAVLLLAVAGGYLYLKRTQRAQLKSIVRQYAREPATRLSTLLETRLQGLRVLEESWSDTLSPFLPREAYQRLVPTFHRYFQGFESIDWIDTSGVIRLVYPEPTSRPTLNQSLREHPDARVRQTFARVARTQEVLSTPIVELLQGGLGFSVYVPVSDTGKTVHGFLHVVYRIDSLMAETLSSDAISQFNVQLLDGEFVAYSHQADSARPERHTQMAAQVPIQFLNQAWTLRFSPSQHFVDQMTSPAPLRVAWSGVVLALLSGVVVFSLVKRRKERQLLLRRLRESEERYRRLVEVSPEAIAVHSEGRLVYINATGVRLLGAKSAEELIGRSVMDFVHPDDRQVVQERIRRSYEDREQVEPLEEKMIRLDGQVIEVEVTSVPVRYQGKPATQVLVRDITESKRLEEQLRRSQKLEAVGRLAGGIAHDFNNILTGITGYCNLVQMSLEADHPSLADLEEINKAAERAASLTYQLLAFSRRQVVEPHVLNLNEVLLGMDQMLRRLIGEDVELSIFYGDELGNIRADLGQLQQVVINLAVNARDAMPRGGKLTIETANVTLDEDYIRRHAEVDHGEYVLLAVTDTGAGIPQDIIDHIFEPFFTTKGGGRGTGLGLATVYGIVKQSGGHIWVYSEQGEGTTFKIYLPRVDEPASRPSPEPSGQLPKGSETILLVEDDEAVRDPAVRFLERLGYNVLVAETALEALELVETEKPDIDLVVTDVVMPKMNGRELFERLQQQWPDLGVIYMSGYTDNVIVHHGVLEEGVAFLQKPFDPNALARKVREVLDEPFER